MTKKLTPRFGIGEWYGYNLTQLTGVERQQLASETLKPKKDRTPFPCPFQPKKQDAICLKEGGVCSLRLYSPATHPETNEVIGGIPVGGKQGNLRATCPHRFHEDLDIFKWAGETILGDPNPLLVSEVGFLESLATIDNEGGDDAGRIDMVLVSTKTRHDEPLAWAALEIQAVCFSGAAMREEFKAFNNTTADCVAFPTGRRRPDYRSSGLKGLMPQLQVKVPTLRRWGKKMAVVVDRAFFDSIGEMDNVSDISNADIVWFVVRFEEVEGKNRTRIVRDEIRYTTLEGSIRGMTVSRPVSLSTFEARINKKLFFPMIQGITPGVISPRKEELLVVGDNKGIIT